MLTNQSKARIAKATVSLKKTGGQGVIVTGGLVLTATHCINWDGRGGMALGDYYLEAIGTKSGASFRLAVLAADPVSDIAVLGSPDDQEFGADCDAFEGWRESTQPVTLRISPPRLRASVRVYILTHRGGWVTGQVINHGSLADNPRGGCLSIEGAKIKSGTSGGPIVDGRGHLVGIVSNSSEAAKEHFGMVPIACWALPNWVLLRIAARGLHESARTT